VYIVVCCEVVMDRTVKNKWKRTWLLGNPPKEVCRGVFYLVEAVLVEMNRQKGLPDDTPAPHVDCEALLTEMQYKCNTHPDPSVLFYNTHPPHRPAHAPPLPTAPTASTSAAPPPTSSVSQPPPPTAPTASTSAAPPPTSAVFQPPPPTASTSAGSSARTPQKRRNADQNNGPSPKRTRDSSVEPDSPIPGPVHHPRRKRPVRRCNLFGIDQSNCVVNRTRAAPTPTELYQEPEQANWGRNGTEAIAMDAFLPTACRLRPRMATCTNCYCQLTHFVNNTTAHAALCVLCGRYKSRNVSIICIFC